MKKIIYLLVMFLLIRNSATAQQDAMFTHYMFNTLWLNPAYAGTRDALTVTALSRAQWVGFDGAPRDQSLTLHAPILSSKAGVGLSFLNDVIGPTKKTTIAADFAYHVQLTKKSKLSFGLKGILNSYNSNIKKLNLDNQNDAAFNQNIRVVTPNVGAGVYYYSERFYAGFSSPALFRSSLDGQIASASRQERHYFFIMGAVLDINKDVKFKPTTFVKATVNSPIEADLTASFILYNKLTAGLMYRTGDAVGILLGFQLTEQFNVGYSFDFSMANTTGKYNNGSHEIMLRFDLISTNKAKLKSPRYF